MQLRRLFSNPRIESGTVHSCASKAEGLERAKSMIERMFQEIEVGKVYTGKDGLMRQAVSISARRSLRF